MALFGNYGCHTGFFHSGIQKLSIIGRGGAKYRDLSCASRLTCKQPKNHDILQEPSSIIVLLLI